jgi:hypothetical protein
MKYNTPTEEELEYIASISRQKRYSPADRDKLYYTYNRIFNTRVKPTTCGNCIANRHKQLMQVLKENS